MAACNYEARFISNETINNTIREEFSNKITYNDLINIITDKEGNIVMLQANTAEMNRLSSQISLSIQERIKTLGKREVRVPLGAMLKNDMFAFYGPRVKFTILPTGSVKANYRSEFEAAGINQTRHVIYLDIEVNLQVIVPIAHNSINITDSIPIAESIIVGKVPNTYFDTNGQFKND